MYKERDTNMCLYKIKCTQKMANYNIKYKVVYKT